MFGRFSVSFGSWSWSLAVLGLRVLKFCMGGFDLPSHRGLQGLRVQIVRSTKADWLQPANT